MLRRIPVLLVSEPRTGGGVEIDRNGLEVLDRAECLRLLGVAPLGRIGFTSGALPEVLPITFHLDGERIVVRTGRGTRLDNALRNAVVAFEADDFDPLDGAGWSVAVTGVAAEISPPPNGHDHQPGPSSPWPVTRWAFPDGEVVLAISTELVSGRRTTARQPTTGQAHDDRLESGPGHPPVGDGPRRGTGPQLETASVAGGASLHVLQAVPAPHVRRSDDKHLVRS